METYMPASLAAPWVTHASIMLHHVDLGQNWADDTC